ncbi:Glyoxylase, beta-lactamase superfamily II [Cyclonatronum proteinivorum]|uniref:Glyoxylase, beta-lactamase superfamily II n=1 Tax=Cyclonatronum proteinivorum TaxID=1457365 RepID=A0A345UK19_9BACT|nr:MBL fold metallo-hydrolase [Cyclonatronum proteinivorum]AXJ00821.1 Glyoxylase, beta-lactamase superfamily II [Cyclonatronum proteinivorum]
MITIETLTVNPFSQNTFLLIRDRAALLIDAGFSKASELNQMIDLLDDHKAQLKAIVITHAHVDHVMGLQRVLDRFDVPVYMSHADMYLWENSHKQVEMFGVSMRPFDFIPEPLPHDAACEIAGFRFLSLFTPGHAPDHVSLYFEEDGFVVAGDVLFNGSIGRTDLYKGDFELLKKSIFEKIYTLPESTEVYCGHGPKTIVGHEKKFNPFVKAEA